MYGCMYLLGWATFNSKIVILHDFTIFLGEFSDPKLLNLSFEAYYWEGVLKNPIKLEGHRHHHPWGFSNPTVTVRNR